MMYFSYYRSDIADYCKLSLGLSKEVQQSLRELRKGFNLRQVANARQFQQSGLRNACGRAASQFRVATHRSTYFGCGQILAQRSAIPLSDDQQNGHLQLVKLVTWR